MYTYYLLQVASRATKKRLPVELLKKGRHHAATFPTLIGRLKGMVGYFFKDNHPKTQPLCGRTDPGGSSYNNSFKGQTGGLEGGSRRLRLWD